MNLYFIVEGRRTEKKVYPEWLNILIPELSRVSWAFEATTNNYFLFNGNGFPALLHNHLNNSIKEINELKKFNYLVLVLDVDETTVEFRISEVNNFIKENNLELNDCELVIIPQDKCIETWFLGNKTIYKSNPQNLSLRNYVKFYNVKDKDPELMPIYSGFNTHSQFHADYCTEFLRERNIRYSKNNPNGVVEEVFLNKLIERTTETKHIKSFQNFLNFCEVIKRKI
jgi:hypothetical protein